MYQRLREFEALRAGSSFYSRRAQGKSTAEANYFLFQFLVVVQFRLSAFIHGVIPKSRVFTSGTRNLTMHSAVEEILRSALSAIRL